MQLLFFLASGEASQPAHTSSITPIRWLITRNIPYQVIYYYMLQVLTTAHHARQCHGAAPVEKALTGRWVVVQPTGVHLCLLGLSLRPRVKCRISVGKMPSSTPTREAPARLHCYPKPGLSSPFGPRSSNKSSNSSSPDGITDQSSVIGVVWLDLVSTYPGTIDPRQQ